MTARILRPLIAFSTVTAVLLAVLAVYAYLNTGSTEAASVYKPTTSVKMCNGLSTGFEDPQLAGDAACVAGTPGTEDLTAGSAADVTTTSTWSSSDMNFSSVVTFAPAGETISTYTNAKAGLKVGGLLSGTNLGLVNGACFTAINIPFILYLVALPSSLTDPRSTGDIHHPGASTNIAFPQAQGTTDRFAFWNLNGVSGGVDTTPGDGINDAVNTVGTPDGATDAGSASLSVQNYPSYLLDLFDPDFVAGGAGGGADLDGTVKPIVPKAVYGGIHYYTQWIPLYFVQFSAGQLSTLPIPLSLFTSNMGQPSVSVLNDPTAIQANPSSITDFCTDLTVTTVLLGTACDSPTVQTAPTPYSCSGTSQTRATNPSAGSATNYFTQYTASFRDIDQDGFENEFDACPLNPNFGQGRLANSPANGDVDSDGIDNSCDTDQTTFGNVDIDADGYNNRGDNCVYSANGLVQLPDNQVDSELSYSSAPNALTPVANPDGGPLADGMGDTCDSGPIPPVATPGPGPTATPIPIKQNGVLLTGKTLSSIVSNGRYQMVTNVSAKCFDGTDSDGDGYCAGQDSFQAGQCAAGPPPPGPVPNCIYRHAGWWTSAVSTSPVNQLDTDKDKWPDTIETYLGTDTVEPCAQTTGSSNDEAPFDNWPLDLTDDGSEGPLDVLKFSAVQPPVTGDHIYGSSVNHIDFAVSAFTGPVKRLDLNVDGAVGPGDILILNNVALGKPYGKTCATAGVAAWFWQ